ncbi:MAG: hypothetical protein ACR2JQ_09500 [Mycobacteriales bacterium]
MRAGGRPPHGDDPLDQPLATRERRRQEAHSRLGGLEAAYVGYAQAGGWGVPKDPSGVPTGAITFAHDIGIRRYAETENTIAHWVDIADRGGHFAALEEPELLTDDIRTFFHDKH